MTNTNTNIYDNSLWSAILGGSDSAFEKLFNRYFQILFSYGKHFVNDEDIIKDAIQDLFLDIWRTKESLSQAQTVQFYLLSSIRRRINRSLKKTNLKRLDWETIAENLLPHQISPEVIYAENEQLILQAQKLDMCLGLLPTRQNEALVLRYYHELEYGQIATLLEIKEQTARNLVQKALQILRKMSLSLLITAVINIF